MMDPHAFITGFIVEYDNGAQQVLYSPTEWPPAFLANAGTVIVRYWRPATPRERLEEERKQPGYKAKIQQAHREVCRQHFAPGRYETRDAKPRDIPARRVPVRRLVTPVPKTGKLLTGR